MRLKSIESEIKQDDVGFKTYKFYNLHCAKLKNNGFFREMCI